MLENLFVTETVDAAVQEEINPQSMAAITASLPDSIATFLKLLISRDAWEKVKLTEIALDMEIKIEDALIEINRKVLSAFDAPLITGEEIIAINRDISAALLI